MLNFEISSGSIIGRNHLGNHQVLKGINNQDSKIIYRDKDMIIGVVSDGCSDAIHPEVGAKIIPRILIRHIINTYQTEKNIQKLLDISRIKTINSLEALINNELKIYETENEYLDVIYDYFLCTIIGFLITDEKTVIFYDSDGVYYINNNYIELPKYPNNAPPYLAYNILPNILTLYTENDLNFKYVYYPTSEIETLLIGSDGVEYLVEAEEKEIPGMKQKVGPISQFWTQDAYFENPDLVSRKLSVLNKDHYKYDAKDGKMKIAPGLLFDDTTMIVARRKKEIIEGTVN